MCGGMTKEELKREWERAWGYPPYKGMGETMLRTSLVYKQREQETGGLPPEQQKRLNDLVKAYRRSPDTFTGGEARLKPGVRLVRTYEGKKYVVTVKSEGFEYNGHIYKSLTKIANDITGSKWNGWVFFGLKKAGQS